MGSSSLGSERPFIISLSAVCCGTPMILRGAELTASLNANQQVILNELNVSDMH